MNNDSPGATHTSREQTITKTEASVTETEIGGAGEPGCIRQRRLASFGVAALAFLLYLLCLSPTVTYSGDCGELIAASYRLGIAHPTGYPLYCLLGRLFALLVPFGEIAWRYNLFSAVAGAATAGLVTATVHRLITQATPQVSAERPRYALWPALGAGLLLAGFYYFGSQSVIAEVYVLSALLLCALLYNAIAWHQSIEFNAKPDWRYCYLLTFLYGLALNTHLSCIFLAPGLLLYVVLQHRAHWSLRRDRKLLGRIGGMIGCFLLAYSLTLYLPLRSHTFAQPPGAGGGLFWWTPLDWGHPVDFPRWLAHVTGRQYRTLLLTPHQIDVAGHTLHYPWFAQPFSTTATKLSSLASTISLQYLWLTPLLLIGAIVTYSRASEDERKRTGGRWLGWMLLSIVILNVGVQIHYEVGDFTNFFFPSYLVMAIWMGLGLNAFFGAMQRWGERLTAKTGAPLWTWRLSTMALVILLGTIAAQWTFFIPLASFRNNTQARRAALERAAAAETLARQSGKTPALLLLNDDTLFSFWYAQYVLHRAPGTRTPWGPPRRKISKEDRLVDLVAGLQSQGPVAVAQWDFRTDARFPYTNLTPSGNLWLASRRALPEPAVAISNSTGKNVPAGTILRAAFRHPRLHLQELAAFEIDFTLPNFAALPANYLKTDAMHHTAQAGWIEVLIAGHGMLKQPSPAQLDVRIEQPTLDQLLAWKQRRRLVIPIGARAGGPFRAVLPLQPEMESPVGECDVWVRLVQRANDRTTPWHPATMVRLTSK